MLFTDAITWNGKHSYNDFGLTIRAPSGDLPEMQVNEVRVPFMQGSYIFSFAFDSRGTYSRRKISLEFNIEGDDPEDIYNKRIKAYEWIMSKQGGELRFDSIPDGYFKDVYAKPIEFNNTLGRYLSTFTVEFSCYPFLILDFSHPAYYTATNTLTAQKYISTIDREVVPAFTTTTTCVVKVGDKFYTIPAKSKRFQIRDIKFSRGENNFSIVGNGKLLIETFEEVL